MSLRNSTFVNGIMDAISALTDDELDYHIGETITEYLDNRLVMTWSLGDVAACIRVNERLMDDNPGLVSDREFQGEVLDYLQNNFDANIGINWVVIDNAISQILWERRKLDK